MIKPIKTTKAAIQLPNGYKDQRALNKVFTDEQYSKGLELIRTQIEALDSDLEEAYQQQKQQSPSKRHFPHYDRPIAGYFFIALEWLESDSNQVINMISPVTLAWGGFLSSDRVNHNPEGKEKALAVLKAL